mgnify:CR=1 FL=1
MPLTGLGTWRLHEPELTPTVIEALTLGYRLIDGAACYENEAALGKCLSPLWDQLIKRKELFITSKLWVTKMKPSLVEEACRKSLNDWGVEYFDMYLVHWPFAFKTTPSGSILYDAQGVAVFDKDISLESTWKAMESLVEKGLVRSIGVSNFTIGLLEKILSIPDLKFKPAVNQVEMHPYRPHKELLDFCTRQGIVLEAHSSLGGGRSPSLLEDPIVLEVAASEKINDPSSVLLAWARQQGVPVIPKSTNPARLATNLKHHSLSQSAMNTLATIKSRHIYCDPMSFWKVPMPN